MGRLDDLRLPPHSLESEESVLGGVMLDNAAYDRIAGAIRARDFYREDHRRIFKTIVDMLGTGQPADVVTVAKALERSGELKACGGLPYISALAGNAGSAANVHRYAEIVRERAMERELLAAAQGIIERAYLPGDPRQKLEQAQQAVMAITEHRSTGALQEMQPLLTSVVERIDLLYNRTGDELPGLPTGLTDLDQRLGGLMPGELIVVAGRPGMGKSAIGGQWAMHAALHCGLPAAVFTLEMPATQLVQRFLASVQRLSGWKLRTGKLQNDDWQSLSAGVGKLNTIPLFIDDTSGLTIGEVRARCRSLHRRQKRLGLVVVDYLQLMRGEGENRTQEIGSLSRGLKGLAKELDCPVVALSQLSRKVEERTDKRPLMSDLRDSGDVEQDADVILMLYRDEEYNPDSPAKGTAEVLIRKFRNGETGVVRVTYLAEYTRFENYSGPPIEDRPRQRSRRHFGDEDQ